MLRLVQALAPGRSLNLPRGVLCSVTLATVLLPSFSDPRFLGLRRSPPLNPPCGQIILLTEHNTRREIGIPIVETMFVRAGKRHLPNPLPSTLSRTIARKIPISTTSSVDHQIPHLPSQSLTALLHARETPSPSCRRSTSLETRQFYSRATTTVFQACLAHPLRSAQ